MKPFIAALLAVLMFVNLAGCNDGKTIDGKYVECIGAFDDPDPEYVYSTDGWNIAMAIIFFEIIVPPIVVIANKTKCPTRKKKAEETSAKGD